MTLTAEQKEQRRLARNAKRRERYANDEAFRNRALAAVKRYEAKWSPAQKKAHSVQHREYRRKKYHTDEEYKKSILDYRKAWCIRNKAVKAVEA